MIAQNHQGVEQEVCDFMDDFLPLSSFRGDEDLPRFLGDLLQNLVMTAFEELGRIRAGLRSGPARRNDAQYAVKDAAVCFRRFLGVLAILGER